MSSKRVQNLLAISASTIAALLAIEFAAHCLVVPLENSYGTLLGRELPPFRVIKTSSPPSPTEMSQWHDGLIVDGRQISKGDLWGFRRADPLLGYAHQENTVSSNGWWQSNNIGARATDDVEKDIPPGLTRMLVFGESFAHGSRVPQEAAWPRVMEREHEGVQVLNLAVDGYSMAQAFLRFRQIRELLDYDVAILMFVPEADLWRDINTIRDLGEADWNFPLVMPRFVMEAGNLRLIRSPYPNGFDVYAHNGNKLSETLRTHLLKYDRFYSRLKYEASPLTHGLILYKLVARGFYLRAEHRLQADLMNPTSEALRISTAIFEKMDEEVRHDGGEFVLVVLPVNSYWWDNTYDASDVNAWRKMVSFVCARVRHCIDLLDTLQSAPANQIDRGYDESHFGPSANRLLADSIWNEISRRSPRGALRVGRQD